MRKAYWRRYSEQVEWDPKCNPLASLLETGEFSDFRLIVGPDEKVFYVHRAIISLNPGYFKSVCALKEHNTHHLPEHDPKIMGYILNNLYEKYDFTLSECGQDYEYITQNILEAAQLFQYACTLDIPSLKGEAMWDINEHVSEDSSQGMEAMKIIFKTYKSGEVNDPNNIDGIFWQYIDTLIWDKTMEKLMKNDEIRGVIYENHDLSTLLIKRLLPINYPLLDASY